MPGIFREAALELAGDAEVVVPVVADRAHVDLRRQAEVQDLGHDVGGLKVEGRLREGAVQLAAQGAHITFSRRVSFLQRDLDHAVIDADGRAVGEGEIVGACRQADVVDDQVEVARRDGFPDLVLDLLEQAARSPRCACRPGRGRGAADGHRR